MKSFDLYLKVEIDVGPEEDPVRVAEELCRMLRKVYAVRKAELSNHVEHVAGS
jgi:hypothetical protein